MRSNQRRVLGLYCLKKVRPTAVGGIVGTQHKRSRKKVNQRERERPRQEIARFKIPTCLTGIPTRPEGYIARDRPPASHRSRLMTVTATVTTTRLTTTSIASTHREHEPMSTTMTMTMAQMPEGKVSACPSCGESLPHPVSSLAPPEAQKKIDDLETQIRLLNQKAASAVDKWADYEDEIHRLRQQLQQQNQEPGTVSEDDRSSSPSRFSYLPVQNRLSSFLSSRKSTPNLQPPPTPATPSATDLAAALTREQALRQAAEGKLDEASGELEELSAQLFEQANEMVAAERKARAKLEQRVELLEKRDGEKRKRLERLEGAVQRIERVRGLLAPAK